MICRAIHCGQAVPAGAALCPRCGERVSDGSGGVGGPGVREWVGSQGPGGADERVVMTIGEVDRLSRAGVVLLFAARWFAVQDNDVRRLRRLVLPALTAEALEHRLVVCWANLGAVLTATELAADLAGGGPRHEGWFLFAGGNRLGHEPVWLTRPPAEIIAAARRLVSGVLDEPVGGPAIALPSAG